MVRQTIGLSTLMIATGFGDSENLILPIVLIAIGAMLFFSEHDEM